MRKSIFALAAIVVLVFSGIAACSALLPSNESLPSNTSTSLPVTAQYYPGPPPPPPDGSYPTPTPTPYPTYPPEEELQYYPPTSVQSPSTAPLAQEPLLGTPPPTEMTPATGEEVTGIGGTPTTPSDEFQLIVSGPRLWILYNGRWTMNSAAIYQGDWTYMLLENDQYQWISTEETYPSGWVDKKDWGWRNSGYHYFRFIGDTVGWHRIIAVGSTTGQSNVIWVYVWPPGPTTFTVNAWAGSSHYNIGSTSQIYYSVNKPCTARVTYLKQNSNVVVSGPSYVSAGTHVDTGTVGYPTGRRTVVVDTWTTGGEYAYDVTSYTVP